MVTYRITVFTGTEKDSGTDANVYITLYGESGNSGERQIGNDRNNFERGQSDEFSIDMIDIGNIKNVRIRHDNKGKKPGWFLDRIIVHNENTDQEWTFPCMRWLARDEDDGQVGRLLDPA
jgi:hypothetical protein